MDTITAEIELVRFGPIVEMTASFRDCPAEPDVGYMHTLTTTLATFFQPSTATT